MAILHRAQIRPSKLELIGEWLAHQPWFDDDSRPELVSLGAFRFDDPAGAVGVETLLVGAGARVLQVPMTYRDAPLSEATDAGDVGEALIGTMEHSVLGKRWVYDATADPVYVNALTATIVAGRPQAEELVETDDGPTARTPTASVWGTGSSSTVPAAIGAGEFAVSTVGTTTVVAAPAWTLSVARVIDMAAADSDRPALLGTWKLQAEPVVLVTAAPA